VAGNSKASINATGTIAATTLIAGGGLPGSYSLVSGSGNIASLVLNSAGFIAPVSGGTSYLLKMPATITAGILAVAAPSTGDGVNESLMSSMAVQGNGTKVQLSTGTTTANDCVKFDSNGNAVDAGSACNSGAGSGSSVSATFSTAATSGTLTHSFGSTSHIDQCVNGSNELVLPTTLTIGSSSDTFTFSGGLSASTVCTATTGGGNASALTPPSSGTNVLLYGSSGSTNTLPVTIGSNLTFSSGTLSASSTAATAFSALTGSTNTSAAMIVGTGASLATSGTGTIAATSATSATQITPITLGTNLSITSGVLNASGSGSSAFSSLTSGTNTSAAMTVGSGASIAPTGSGTVTANAYSGQLPVANGGSGTSSPTLVAGTNVTITGSWPNQTITASSTGSTAFSALTGSTNTSAAMVIGTGASLATTGSGSIAATTASALASTPTTCSTGYAPTGILANGNATGCASIGSGGSGLQPPSSGTNVLITASNGSTATSPVTIGTGLSLASGTLSATGTTTSSALVTVSNAHTAFGDSITAGTGASITNTDYVNDLTRIENSVPSNFGVAGNISCDQSGTMVNTSPTYANNPIMTEMIGTNDANNGVSQTLIFEPCWLGGVTWVTIANSQKIFSATQTGSWSNFGSGYYSTTNGSTLTYSITTTGGPIYLWDHIDSTWGSGAFSLTIDGTSEGSFSSYPAAFTGSGNNNGLAGYRFPVSSGTHTVVATVTSSTSSSNIVGIYGVGTAPPSSQIKYLMPPRIFVGGVPRQQGDANSSTTAAYNSDVVTMASELAGDGLNVVFVNIRATLCSQLISGNCAGPSGAYDMANSLHPNDQGHLELAQAFSAAEQVVPSSGPLVGYTTAPTCTVTAPSSGTTATCTASIYSGAVVFAGVTLAGNGYISGPVSVTFSGGSGSGATATAYPRSPVASNSNPLYPIWNPSTSVGSNNQSFVMNQSYPTGSARWQTQGVNQLPCDVLASQGCYGIRKQKAGYTGNAINVTCISGSPTFDVPFTSSGSLDSTYLSQCTVAATSVLASYWGAYINTWYDQSGNANNLTQSNTANKPIIAQYTLIGGVPSVMFQSSFFNPAGGYEFLNIPNGVTANQKQFGVFGAMRFDNQLDQSSGITLGTSTSVNFYQNNGGMADSLCGALYVYPAAGAQTFSWWADNTNRHYSNWGDNTSDGYQCAAGNNGNLTVGGTVSFANVNPNPGTYGSSTQCAVISVNSSGLITSASSVACAGGSGGITALTGDVTGSGTGSIATTLATVNSNVGTFGTSTQCATFTVNAKGLVTAASQSTNCPGGSGGTVIAGTVQNEVPVGAINGTNATFTISHTPSPTYIQLYRNGLLQALGTDYSLTGTTITFITASIPQSGDTLAAWYTYGTGGGGSGNATTVNGAAIPNNAVIVSNISGQLVNGNAAVVNINNRGVLRDYQNALDNGNFSTNGIASAITACGTSVTCAVLAPPAYPTGELVPGTSITNWFDGSPPSAITTSSTITVHDQRWGMDMSTILNCLGYNVPGSRICNVPQYDYIESLANLRVFDNLGPEVIVMNAMDGGTNQGNAFLSGLQTNKINWFGGGHTVNRWTAGQAEGAGVSMNCYGLGDCLGRSDTLHCYIGPNADSDEGCEWWDAEEFGPPDEPTGTVGSYSSNLLTVSSWTHGQGHQGQGRFVIRENAGTLTGTLAATNPISSPGNGPTVVTVSGTLTASTVVGTTGAFSANPSVAGLSYTATVTPTFTTGNISLITSSTQVC
ncbi:unnamed protein product, partial [Sphagnum balticum]